MEFEITERKCNECGFRKQCRKDDVGGQRFLGWFKLRMLARDGHREYDLCRIKCLKAFAAKAEEE
jgi:hypothetical protein